MNDPQNERPDDAEVPGSQEAGLNQLMRMIAYKDVTERFNHAIFATQRQVENPDVRLQLNESIGQLQAHAANLDPNRCYTAVLLVVEDHVSPDGKPGWNVQRAMAGSPAAIDSLLPLVHLLFGFEQNGLMPPPLNGCDVEVEVSDEDRPGHAGLREG